MTEACAVAQVRDEMEVRPDDGLATQGPRTVPGKQEAAAYPL